MRLNVNHVAKIYVTEQRKIVPETDQCSVTYAEERHAVIFRDFNMAGCAETETYRQTNDDSETDPDDIEIVEAVLQRGEAAESDDYSHIVQPYRFEPYLAMPDGVDSAIAAYDSN